MPAVLFLFTFLVYLSGLCGTIPAYRDSGDLIATVSTLGIAHPPGYPTYVLLGQLFGRLVPLGNWAYRVNLFSAVCAAGSAMFLFQTLRNIISIPARFPLAPLSGRGQAGPEGQARVRGFPMLRETIFRLLHCGESPHHHPPPESGGRGKTMLPILMALAFAFTPAVMTLARVAEMYTCTALFAAAILFLMTSETPRIRLAAFLLGLGLGVHPTLLFLMPLFFVPRFFCRRIPKVESGLFFLLGVSIFLFLPIRSAGHPLQNWGDPSHWRNFWRVVTRADYGGLKLHPEQSEFHWTLGSVAQQIAFWGRLMMGQWTGVGFAVSLSAWVWLLLRGKQAKRWNFLACVLLSGPLFVVLSNLPIGEATSQPILQPYLVLNNLLWVLGLACLLNQGIKAAVVGTGILFLGIIVALPPLSQASLRNDFYAYDYGRNLMRSLPSGALLYDPDDPTAFTLRALQVNEHRRTDLILLNFFRTRWGYEQMVRDYPDLLPPVPIDNGADLQRILWSYSIQRHPFYVELPQKLGKVPYHSEGIVYRVDAGMSSPLPGHGENLLSPGSSPLVTRGIMKTTAHSDFFTSHLIDYYAAADSNLGMEFASRKEWDRAIAFYKAALVIDPELSAAYNNWGIAAYEQGNYVLAEALYKKAIQLEPGNGPFGTNLELALQAEGRNKLPGK